MKYIFISGGVISGIGKGIATASITLLLKSAGYKVSPIKMDPYLNVDAGTMNPVIHGEVFVLDDGSETDQDLGHYERFASQSLNKTNFTTSGQVYLSVIQKERNLGYDGECVEAIPHITEEFLKRIEDCGKAGRAEIVVIEIGGTVGEMQNSFIFEANRILKLKKPNDVLHIHLSYLPIPPSVGEMKSKPAQMSVRELNSLGIQPDILLARCEVPLDLTRRKKLALFCALEDQDIISAPDVENIYQIPLNFEAENLTERVLKKLHLKRRKKDLKKWKEFVKKSNSSQKNVKIGIVGKYFATGNFSLGDSYISVIEAIKHASAQLGFKPEISWIDSGKILSNLSNLSQYQGIIVPGGFGSRDVEGKLATIQYARGNNIPYLGLCFGMQLAVVEYARNVIGLKDAHSSEVDPKTKHSVIHIMPDQEKKMLKKDYGGSMRLGEWPCLLKKGTLAWKLYLSVPKTVDYQSTDEGLEKKRFLKETEGYQPSELHSDSQLITPNSQLINERHRHRYEVNNKYREILQKHGLVISGTSPDKKLVETIELLNHPFFIATQFHPELKSRPLNPHPLFLGFIKSVSGILK